MIAAEHRTQARELYLAGLSCREIARQLGVQPNAIWYLRKREDWDAQRAKSQASVTGLRAGVARLAQLKKPNESQARALDRLTKALERMERAAAREIAEIRNQRKPRKTEVRSARDALIAKAIAPEFGLRLYQVSFLLDRSRFRVVKKGRQTGFSKVMALDALIEAATGEEHSVIASASQDQADLVMAYAFEHAEKLGLEVMPSGSEMVLPNGRKLVARPANFRTIQGFSGNLYWDEFAWVMRAKTLWEASVPTITIGKKRLTVSSTPYEKGNLFWQIAENHQGRWERWSRHVVSIHTAIRYGAEVDLDEIRSLFDADSFARLYELRYFDDEDSFFSFDEINACVRPNCLNVLSAGRLYGGVDIGRTRDATDVILVEWGSWNEDGDSIGETVIVRFQETYQRMPFDQQRERLRHVLKTRTLGRMYLDRTGIGMDLAEGLQREFPGVVHGVHFTRELKEELALTLKRLFEQRRIIIPPDPRLIAAILSIKRVARESGITYDSDRNAETGHADAFWALALACRDLGPRQVRRLVTARIY